jgi:hypothetical protein
VSRDGRLVAITVQRENPCPPPGQGNVCRPYADVTSLLVVDAGSGSTRLTIDQNDPRFAGFTGQMWLITWRDDGAGFLVQGGTQSEAPGGIASVRLDGSVVVLPHLGYGINASPNGRYAFTDDLAVCDLSSAPERHLLEIRDAESNAVLAQTSDPVLNIMPYEWSPDGEELLYETSPLIAPTPPSACKQRDPDDVSLYLLRAGSTEHRPVAGVIDARQAWYGNRLIEYRCNGAPSIHPYCLADNATQVAFDVLNQGHLIVSTTEFRLIGWVG